MRPLAFLAAYQLAQATCPDGEICLYGFRTKAACEAVASSDLGITRDFTFPSTTDLTGAQGYGYDWPAGCNYLNESGGQCSASFGDGFFADSSVVDVSLMKARTSGCLTTGANWSQAIGKFGPSVNASDIGDGVGINFCATWTALAGPLPSLAVDTAYYAGQTSCAVLNLGAIDGGFDYAYVNQNCPGDAYTTQSGGVCPSSLCWSYRSGYVSVVESASGDCSINATTGHSPCWENDAAYNVSLSPAQNSQTTAWSPTNTNGWRPRAGAGNNYLEGSYFRTSSAAEYAGNVISSDAMVRQFAFLGMSKDEPSRFSYFPDFEQTGECTQSVVPSEPEIDQNPEAMPLWFRAEYGANFQALYKCQDFDTRCDQTGSSGCNSVTGDCICKSGFSGAACGTYDSCWNTICNATGGSCNGTSTYPAQSGCDCNPGYSGAACDSYSAAQACFASLPENAPANCSCDLSEDDSANCSTYAVTGQCLQACTLDAAQQAFVDCLVAACPSESGSSGTGTSGSGSSGSGTGTSGSGTGTSGSSSSIPVALLAIGAMLF